MEFGNTNYNMAWIIGIVHFLFPMPFPHPLPPLPCPRPEMLFDGVHEYSYIKRASILESLIVAQTLISVYYILIKNSPKLLKSMGYTVHWKTIFWDWIAQPIWCAFSESWWHMKCYSKVEKVGCRECLLHKFSKNWFVH